MKYSRICISSINYKIFSTKIIFYTLLYTLYTHIVQYIVQYRYCTIYICTLNMEYSIHSIIKIFNYPAVNTRPYYFKTTLLIYQRIRIIHLYHRYHLRYCTLSLARYRNSRKNPQSTCESQRIRDHPSQLYALPVVLWHLEADTAIRYSGIQRRGERRIGRLCNDEDRGCCCCCCHGEISPEWLP